MKTELRIGNIISYENTAHVIEELHSDKVIHHWIETRERYVSPYESIDGFPLNEEWLVSFGFVKNQYSAEGVQYNEPFYHIELECKGWRFGYNEDFGWVIHPVISDYNIIPIKHVHQLQNLYFSLTGEELKFKP